MCRSALFPAVLRGCGSFVVDVDIRATVLTGGAGGLAAVCVVLADCREERGGGFRW